jgi:hypothetical protein
MYEVITLIVPPLETENRLATHLNSETARHGFSHPGSRLPYVAAARDGLYTLKIIKGT